ncbi:MAG: hypothetical protein CMM56_08885 [Rhodospirillaceae bacterium]|nr:hypothetical protein [Rhodospirillaceae bacterium]
MIGSFITTLKPLKPLKVLIVGAGPSGLTAAVELSRMGLLPDLVDKKEYPSSLSRAVGILPATMQLLEPSNVAYEIEKQSIVVHKIKFHKNSELIAEVLVNLFSEKFFNMYALAQDKTESILADKFQEYGGSIAYKTEVTDLQQKENKVFVKLNNEIRPYDIVIGADGTKSIVRECAGIEFLGYELADDWSIADVYTDDSMTNTDFKVFLKKKNKAAIMVPLEKHRVRIISNTENALDEVPLDMPINKIKRTGKFKIEVKQAERYSKGRVFLVGDAAHSHSPVGGRGMNLGIADAADLANKIVNGGLDQYHIDRYLAGEKIIKFTEKARKTVLSGNRFKKELIFFFLVMISKSKILNKIFIRRLLTI